VELYRVDHSVQGASPLDIAEVLGERKSIVALTGAGLGQAAGISVFRRPDGSFLSEELEIWLQREYYDAATVPWYEKYWDFHDSIAKARPTQGHLALRAMVEAGVVSHVVTQNVDGLDLRAGTDVSHVSEVHGIDRRLSCPNFAECGFEVSTEDWLREYGRSLPPLCPDDGQILKPDFNLYGEKFARRDIVENAIRGEQVLKAADAILAVGTSLSIQPWRRIVIDKSIEQKPIVVVNPNPTTIDRCAHLMLRGDADDGLTLLREQLVN